MFKRFSPIHNYPSAGRSEWLFMFPFACFVVGYFVIAHFFGAKEIQTPALIGKQLQDAARELSALNLNLRIVTEKADAELSAGTILSQTPTAGKHIKENQSIFIVISKKLQRPLAPECINKRVSNVRHELEESGIQIKNYSLPSTYPKDLCFAQSPAARTEIAERVLIYVSAGSNKPVIWPDFTGKPVAPVLEFLKAHDITAQVIQAGSPQIPATSTESLAIESTDQQHVVTDQRPLAGSLVTLEEGKLPQVQLQI